MAQRFYVPFTQLFTNLGAIGAGWKLYTYETLTTTPKPTYSDTGLSIQNPNPVVADADGRISENMWVSDPSLYKLVLTDENDVVIQTTDPVQSISGSSIINLNPLPAAYWGITDGTSSVYTLDSNVAITQYSSSYCFFLDFHIACVASPTININEIGAIDLKKYTGSGTKTDLEAGDVQTQRYIAIIDGTDCVILNPEKPYFDSRNLTQSTTAIRGVSYLSSQVTIANNGSDANNDIDFSAGVFQFSDGSGQAVASAQTKRLDATWAAGTNQGGLFSGSKANSTWYHCFKIYNPTTNTVDSGFDTSVTAANIPSGYTKYKRVGAILTDGSGNIRAFYQDGNIFRFRNYISDYNGSVSTTRQTIALSVPPSSNALFHAYLLSAAGGGSFNYGIFTNLDSDDVAPSATQNHLNANAGFYNSGQFIIKSNSSSSIGYRGFFATGTDGSNLAIGTEGWIDYTI